MMIYSIKLSKNKQESDFEKFMQDEVFPHVHKEQQRNGKIDGLVLLKGSNTGHTNEYLWLVYGGLNGGAAEQQTGNIKAFGARVLPLQDFIECARWFSKKKEGHLL